MAPRGIGKKRDRFLGRGSGAKHPKEKTLRVPMPGTQEKNGLFVLHDGETAVAE